MELLQLNNNIQMETAKKELYSVPVAEILEMKNEGIICLSDQGEGTLLPMEEPEDLLLS
jgi:hypothetical protein